MTVSITDGDNSNCCSRLFLLILLLAMITMVGTINVKLKYFSKILMMEMIIVKYDCDCNYKPILIL